MGFPGKRRAEEVNAPTSPVEWLGMARWDRFRTDAVRPCLVRWSNEAGPCDDRPSRTPGWERESETGIVAQYRTDNRNGREGEGLSL